MFITNKTLPRRTVLRGLGSVIALPFLESMLPARANAQNAVAAPLRFGAVYVPNGIPMAHAEPQWIQPGAAGELELMPIAVDQGMGLIVWGPLAGGLLSEPGGFLLTQLAQAGAAGGFLGLVEAIRQLTDETLGAAVADARHGLVSCFGMINYDRGLCSSAAILSRSTA